MVVEDKTFLLSCLHLNLYEYRNVHIIDDRITPKFLDILEVEVVNTTSHPKIQTKSPFGMSIDSQ